MDLQGSLTMDPIEKTERRRTERAGMMIDMLFAKGIKLKSVIYYTLLGTGVVRVVREPLHYGGLGCC